MSGRIVRWPPSLLVAGLAWLVLTVGADLALTIPRGRFTSGPDYTGWLDLTTVLQEVVVFPLLAFYYLWVPMQMRWTLEALKAQHVLAITRADEDWLARAFSGQWRSGMRLRVPWLPVVIVLVAAAIALTLWWSYSSTLSTRLWLAYPGIAPINVIFWTVNAFMATWLVVRMAIFDRFLGCLFAPDRPIRVEPLHPDGCGDSRRSRDSRCASPCSSAPSERPSCRSNATTFSIMASS